jgi:hypothetical protein
MLPAFPGRETDSRRIIIICNSDLIAEQIALRLHVQAIRPLPADSMSCTRYLVTIEQTPTFDRKYH